MIIITVSKTVWMVLGYSLQNGYSPLEENLTEEGGHAEDLVYEELDDGQGDVHEVSLRG